MKSLCIKTNNEDIISSLFQNLSTLNLDSALISQHHFKVYNNVIIHYTGTDYELFYDRVASILTDTIIEFYQEKLLKRILEYNYFYFTSSEKKKILSLAKDFIADDDLSSEDNYFSIYYPFLDYITENKSIVLDGFVNFRLQTYMKNLDYIIDISVNKFLIEKEYNEFIDILKMYVAYTPFNSPLVHLVYCNGESTLLDIDKKVIPTDDAIFQAKYLSDITFSSNDYALNTLLNLTPKKIIIHLVNYTGDEFINTIKLIFEDRYEICTDCKICSLYKTDLITK